MHATIKKKKPMFPLIYKFPLLTSASVTDIFMLKKPISMYLSLAVNLFIIKYILQNYTFINRKSPASLVLSPTSLSCVTAHLTCVLLNYSYTLLFVYFKNLNPDLCSGKLLKKANKLVVLNVVSGRWLVVEFDSEWRKICEFFMDLGCK